MPASALVPTRCWERLTEARLHTLMLSRSWGRQISVHRFDRWMVPVLLFSALVLIVSFHASHGCEVVCREIRIALNCSRALILRKRLSSPRWAPATYSA